MDSSHLPSQPSPFERYFGSKATRRHPLHYHLIVICEHGGVELHIPWSTMELWSGTISRHEDAFAWSAMSPDSRSIHLSLLECSLHECAAISQSPRCYGGAVRCCSFMEDAKPTALVAFAFLDGTRKHNAIACLEGIESSIASLNNGAYTTRIEEHFARSLSFALSSSKDSDKRTLIDTALEAIDISHAVKTAQFPTQKTRL